MWPSSLPPWRRARTASTALLAALALLSARPVPADEPDGSICGYASATSVAQGQFIGLHISTVSPTYSIEFIDALDPETVLRSYDGLTGFEHAVPDSSFANGCGWPALHFPIDASWPSGVYYARLVTAPPVRDTAYIPFVVREDTPGSTSNILFQCSTHTYQAYNNWGGKSLYPQDSTGGVRSFWVSYDRPYVQEDGRGEFPWWEQPLAAWLRDEGITVEFCTNVDLHDDPDLLQDYDLLMVVGHDEYWSKEMYDQVEAFRDAGGNLAFLSGNVCFWAVRLEEDGRRLVCYKDYTYDPYYQLGLLDQVTDLWRVFPLNRPEAALIGVAYDSWCWRPCGVPARPVQVHHWTTRGLGFQWWEDVGVDVIGYEWDRYFPGWTPPSIELIFNSNPINSIGEGRLQHSSYYQYPGEAVGPPTCRVFAAGTVQWSWGVWGENSDPRLAAMTRRVIRCLSNPQYLPEDRQAVFSVDLSETLIGTSSIVWLYGKAAPLSTTLPELMRDDGVWPDPTAADSVYTAAVTFPAGTWSIVDFWYETTNNCTNQIHSVWLDDPEILVGGTAYLSTDRMLWCPPAIGVADPADTPAAPADQAARITLSAVPRGAHVDIDARLPEALLGAPIRATIHDVRGRLVRTLIDAPAAHRTHYRLRWDGRDSRGAAGVSGVYFLRVEAARTAAQRKIVWVR